MKCFNCEFDMVETGIERCSNCSAIFNETKYNFISYIGAPDSLVGYQRSYKLVLLRYIIEAMLEGKEPSVQLIISQIKKYYTFRKSVGLPADYDVDKRISEIESSSDYDVFAVFKSQPFKVINEKGFLFLNRNEEHKLVFVFNEDLIDSFSKEEWKKLLNIIIAKLDFYYKQYDDKKVASPNKSVSPQEPKAIISKISPDMSVLDVDTLSVRAKNVLMRSRLYTIGDILEFDKEHDLIELKNMGSKTKDEIKMFLRDITPSNHADSLNKSDCSEQPDDLIDSLFTENKYHIFVEYCERMGYKYISDLRGFDFSSLLNEHGFGTTKLNAIKSRYNTLLSDPRFAYLASPVLETATEVEPALQIHDSNKELSIEYLTFANISGKQKSQFAGNGYYTIGHLRKLSPGDLIQMFGHQKGQEMFEKLKFFEKSLHEIITERLNSFKGSREFDIYIERTNQKTLQEIAQKYGVTRERVRQIESKFFRQFAPLFGVLIDQHLERNGVSFISVSDILEFFDDDLFDSVILHMLKELYSLEYLSFADIFVKKQTASQNTKEKLYKLTIELIGEDGLNFFDNLSQIEEMLNNSGLDFISTDAFLNYLIEINAYFYGDFVFLQKQTYVKLCLLLISKYFPDGIAVYSDEDIDLLRNYFRSEYGEFELPSQNRAISARLSDQLITCGRGKAKLIENFNFDQSVMEDIKNYIDSSPLKSIYFSEIFNEFEGILAFTSDITNYHGLHGILSYLYKDEYEFSRDYITKIKEKGKSLNLAERIVMFITEKGRAVSRNEIKQKIGGLTDVMLFNATNKSKELLQWDYNSFNATSNLFVAEKDISNLENIIEYVFSKFKGYCSDRLIFEKVKAKYPEFILKNNIENATNLFYLLHNLFGDKYQFSRPHICRKGIFEALTTKNVALYLLNSNKEVSRSSFMEIAKNVCWSITTADLMFCELEKEYVRISDDLYILAEDFYIEKEALNLFSSWLNSKVNTDGYLSMIGFSDYDDLPAIQYEWNTFLIVSLISRYNLGVKLVSPTIRDRRYNKEIVVSKNSDFARLDDIVHSLLVKNEINFIDEANLLSFLILNHLAAKTIPKELFESNKFVYADGYFKTM